jgi:hypothetical protein
LTLALRATLGKPDKFLNIPEKVELVRILRVIITFLLGNPAEHGERKQP